MAEGTKLFGMPAEKGRWMYVVLGFIVNICLGSVYAYGIFGKQLAKPTEWNLDLNTSGGILSQQIPFGVFLLCFALLFLFSGQFLAKLGPKKQGIIGGIVVALGWILASFVVKYTTSVPLLVLTYGVIGGAGVGISYIVPIQAATRWFPDKKGLATGLALAGFGGSPFISTYLGQKLISMSGPDGQLSDAFLYLGIMFLVVILIASWFTKFPEAGWKPAGWTPKVSAKAATSTQDLDRKDIIKTRRFWMLFACYTIGALAGLMAIGIYANVATLVGIGLTMTVVQFVLAPFNAGGRPLLGFVTDKMGPRIAAIITFLVILAGAIIMIFVRSGDLASQAHKIMYFVAFIAFYLGLGGWLAIAPTATAQYFGVKNSARNYGVVFLAYGVGGLVATFVAAYSKQIFTGSGGVINAFIPVAILAGLGLVLAFFFMKPPKAKEVEGPKK
ncbi:MAG: OFA family MFS transporter [Dehalococcoidia bacterium]|jgi:MFS family permease